MDFQPLGGALPAALIFGHLENWYAPQKSNSPDRFARKLQLRRDHLPLRGPHCMTNALSGVPSHNPVASNQFHGPPPCIGGPLHYELCLGAPAAIYRNLVSANQ